MGSPAGHKEMCFMGRLTGTWKTVMTYRYIHGFRPRAGFTGRLLIPWGWCQQEGHCPAATFPSPALSSPGSPRCCGADPEVLVSLGSSKMPFSETTDPRLGCRCPLSPRHPSPFSLMSMAPPTTSPTPTPYLSPSTIISFVPVDLSSSPVYLDSDPTQSASQSFSFLIGTRFLSLCVLF